MACYTKAWCFEAGTVRPGAVGSSNVRPGGAGEVSYVGVIFGDVQSGRRGQAGSALVK